MEPRLIAGVDELRRLVGQEIGCSEWLTISQPMIDAFADITDDRQWIHVDGEKAKTDSPFGVTIAHGFLTLSLLSRLLRSTVQMRLGQKMSLNYGFNRIRFVSPAPAGSRIRGRFTLLSLEEIPGGRQLTWDVAVEREGGDKPVLVAEWLGRLYH